MSKNLRHELRNAVMTSFKEHTDKHSIKHENREQVGIWSYGSRNNMLDRINTFSRWASEQGINKLDQVTQDTIQRFLTDKSNQGVTQRTLDEYRSSMARLGALVGRDWTCDRVMGCTRAKSEDRGAESVISKDDLDKLCQYALEHPSSSGDMLLLERELGVRVSDLCYGTRVVGDHLEINSKGGRVCTRPITPEVAKLLDRPSIKANIDDKGHLHAPKDASVNKWLNRTEDTLRLQRHSFHDIRRCIAQQKYDEYRHSGLDRTQSLEQVGVWLNHGEHRATMVLESYIGHAW